MPLEIPFLHDSNDNNFPEYYIPTSCKEQSYLYIYIYIYRGRIEIDRKRGGGYLRGLGPATTQKKNIGGEGCLYTSTKAAADCRSTFRAVSV